LVKTLCDNILNTRVSERVELKRFLPVSSEDEYKLRLFSDFVCNGEGGFFGVLCDARGVCVRSLRPRGKVFFCCVRQVLGAAWGFLGRREYVCGAAIGCVTAAAG
jgi:hypothetical protein